MSMQNAKCGVRNWGLGIGNWESSVPRGWRMEDGRLSILDLRSSIFDPRSPCLLVSLSPCLLSPAPRSILHLTYPFSLFFAPPAAPPLDEPLDVAIDRRGTLE